ncbi:hypothetical protein NOF04DRAFT_1329383, partial [Fusarium oxysporum II5]
MLPNSSRVKMGRFTRPLIILSEVSADKPVKISRLIRGHELFLHFLLFSLYSFLATFPFLLFSLYTLLTALSSLLLCTFAPSYFAAFFAFIKDSTSFPVLVLKCCPIQL